MRKKALLLLSTLVLLTVFVTACAGGNTNTDGLEVDKTSKVQLGAELLDVADVEFQLTDTLVDYMQSKDLNDLALVTVLCRS